MNTRRIGQWLILVSALHARPPARAQAPDPPMEVEIASDFVRRWSFAATGRDGTSVALGFGEYASIEGVDWSDPAGTFMVAFGYGSWFARIGYAVEPQGDFVVRELGKRSDDDRCMVAEVSNGEVEQRSASYLAPALDKPAPGAMSSCPHGFFASDEQAGATLLRTCARPAKRYGDGSTHAPIDLLSIAATDGRIDALWLDQSNLRLNRFTEPDLRCIEWLGRGAKDMSPAERGVELDFLWDAHGRLVSLESGMDGVRSGETIVFYADGSPAVVGFYSDGLAHGVWHYLAPDGTPVAARLYVYGVYLRDVPIEVRDMP